MKLIVLDINNLTDARYFAAWNVDYLALNVDPRTEKYVSPEYFHALQTWIEGPRIILIPSLDQEKEIPAIAKLYTEDSFFLIEKSEPTEINQKYFQRIAIQSMSTPNEVRTVLSKSSEGIILDFSSTEINWDDLIKDKLGEFDDWKELFINFPIYIQMDLGPNEINQMIKTGVYGICLKGGDEEKVGVKSFDELDEIFETLEEIQQK